MTVKYVFYFILGTNSGILKQKFTRSEFNPCGENLLESDDVLGDKEISLREAAGTSNILGAQGYKKCHCKTACKSNKCSCRAKGRLCNSKCHGSLNCTNKHE